MIWWSKENIFLPPKYLQDLKRADESSLSFLRNLSDAFSLHYAVGDLYAGPIMINIIRKKLNTQLRPFRGIFTQALAVFHKRKLEAAVNIVQPIVESRLRELQADPTVSHPDAIQWAIELAHEGSDPREWDPRRLTLNTLQNLWAGSAGPAVSVTQMLFQVLAMPEYLEPLGAEAHQAISTYGWTDKALNNMPLLDSFIREVNRVYPLGSITAARTVMDDHGFTFHDGLTLPQGTRIAFAIGAIQKDDQYIPRAADFDGFRFARKHVKDERIEETGAHDASNAKRYLHAASTVTEGNLVFGYGKHACPGRFYAIRKTKIIFCKIALRYDLKWTKQPDGGRPKEFPVEGQFAPNLQQEISFRENTASVAIGC
ncbi:hypothetical protein SLS53_002443 [Cytospora paraplurivora]|uniref:Cytochrome P450 n=1 Tax=Cytospora paraplurivora TaxID=2898453 RepID=A0AAN9UDY8_9PEZI